jgi:hypothetical protein
MKINRSEQAQFLHHQLGLYFKRDKDVLPIGGDFIPSWGWTGPEFSNWLDIMGEGKSWTPTLVEELANAGALPMPVYKGKPQGISNLVLAEIRAKHEADPQVISEVCIDFDSLIEGEEGDTETFVSRHDQSDTMQRDAWFQEQIKDQYPDYVFNAEEHEIEVEVIKLENRYDYWMAKYQPIPCFVFDGDKPVDLRIDISSSDIPLGINPQHVWSRIAVDNCEVIVPGYHWCNRLAYIVTNQPWDADADGDIEVID